MHSKKDRDGEQDLGCWYKFKRCCGTTISKERRKIYMGGKTLPSSYPTNRMNNQKYNVITFLPKVLFNEFKLFFNMFFLWIALS